MEDFIVASILVILAGTSLFYIWKEKKNGRKCIGCPYSGKESCHCK